MRKIEFVLCLGMFAFFISQIGMAQNQTVRINIELPAGVGLSSTSSSTSSYAERLSPEAFSDGYEVRDFSWVAADGSFVPLIWIKMRTYENSQFLLDFKNKDNLMMPSSVYFLNDNTNNLQNAQSLQEFPALLNFNQKGILIRSFVPRMNTLSAWLGFYPENQPVTLLLEYF
nr:hypothetical protein [Cytophagales bacterium]